MIIFREISRYARGTLMRTRRAWRRISSLSNPGFVVVLILCVLTIVSFAFGFAFQPSASTPPEVPNPPELNLTFQSGSPRYLSVYSFLEQTSGQLTELVVDATGVFTSNQSATHWTLGILGFTGYLCQKPASAPSLVPLAGFPHDYEINGNSNIPATSGQPFLVIGLCWDNGAPLIADGSYISAALSPILSGPGQSGAVTRSLVLERNIPFKLQPRRRNRPHGSHRAELDLDRQPRQQLPKPGASRDTDYRVEPSRDTARQP